MQNPPPPPGYSPPPPPPQMSGGQPAPMAYPAPASAYGGFWIRAVAYIIDAIILGIVGGILSAPFGVNYSDALTTAPAASSRMAGGIDLVLSLLYFAGMWSYMGATLGQRIFGLRVVDAVTGARLTVGKAALRWLGLLLAFFACFIGVIWVAFDSHKQGWADKIAGTYVVRG